MHETEPKFVSVSEAILEFAKQFESQTDDDFFPTGFDSHDKALGRFKRCQVVFVGARPSMGKTAWMLSSTLNQLEDAIHVYYFTLEMRRVDMIARLISIKSGIPLFKIVQNQVDEGEVKRMISVLPVIKELPGDWGTDSLLSHIEKLFNQIKPKSRSIAYVDFLGLIEVAGLGGG